MDTKEQYELIRSELKDLSKQLQSLNAHCNDRLTKIENTKKLNEPLRNEYDNYLRFSLY